MKTKKRALVIVLMLSIVLLVAPSLGATAGGTGGFRALDGEP